MADPYALTEYELWSKEPESLNVGQLNRAVRMLREAHYQMSLKAQERAALVEEVRRLREIEEDFRKCYDVAMMASSYWPELSGSWTGTVSERLQRTFAAEHEAREAAEQANAALRERVRALEEALRELLGSPATFRDERVSYEDRQIDRATLEAAEALLSPASAQPRIAHACVPCDGRLCRTKDLCHRSDCGRTESEHEPAQEGK